MRLQGLSRYAASIGGVLAAASLLLLVRDHVNETTAGFSLLLVVLFVATAYGMGPAVSASIVGVVAFNYFFVPPYGTLHVEEPRNWIALTAFLVTAVTAGQLSASARRRAEEAEAGRLEIERLYGELSAAFDRASTAEADRQAERLKSALLDAVTHDLRTPLTSIKASVSMLLDDLRLPADFGPLASDSRKELLEVVDEEVDRLDGSIGSLIELARIEAGRLELRRRWVSVGEVVEEALARARRHARRHRFETDVDPETPPVWADGPALAEVVYTVVDNAAKYSPDGAPVGVRVRGGADGGVVVSIEDRGAGIPPPLRDRVFERFVRATGSDQPPGSGMGLAIARGIVDAHGGRIWIEDGASGTGTRVVFELPGGQSGAPDAGRPAPVEEPA
jgi:K+-sensing histidine kinase KdpD